MTTPPSTIVQITTLTIRPIPLDRIKDHPKVDQKFEFIKSKIDKEKLKDFTMNKDKTLYYQ